jgi:hypothetical protein
MKAYCCRNESSNWTQMVFPKGNDEVLVSNLVVDSFASLEKVSMGAEEMIANRKRDPSWSVIELELTYDLANQVLDLYKALEAAEPAHNFLLDFVRKQA